MSDNDDDVTRMGAAAWGCIFLFIWIVVGILAWVLR